MTNKIQNGIKEIGQIVQDKNRLVFQKFNLAEMESNIAKFDALLAENADLTQRNACLNKENQRLRQDYELLRGNNVVLLACKSDEQSWATVQNLETERDSLSQNLSELQYKYEQLFQIYQQRNEKDKN